MSNKLYLIDVVVQTYREGADLHGFTERIGAMLAGYSNATRPLHRFKVSGEGRVLAVFEVNNILGLERAVAGLWRMGGVTVSCIPLIPYDAFAQFLGVDLAQTLPSSSSPCQLGDKNLYWLEWAVESRGMDMEQLLAAWKEEASTLLSSRKQGIELDIFKVVAEHKVHIFLSMEDPMEVDKLSFMLPMMQHAGNSVRIQCRAVQSLDDYAKKVMKENL